MTPEQHARIKDVFLKVIECPPEQRAELLAASCGDDAELRREVQRLLDNHAQGTIHVADFLIPHPTTATANRDDRATHTDGPAATAGATTPEQLATGTVIAERYRVVQMLGEGGMGQVYRVEDLVLNQTVALKFLNPFMAGSPEWLDRFHKEAKLARTIAHTNVCRVYDIGDWQGSPFISMEYVDGEDLATLLRRIGRVPGDKAVELAGQICAGLAAAHAHGVLHRDLKPANIMVDGQGQVRITDFGLAGLEGQIRGAEIRSGTPAYMSPEQLRGSAVTSRSDIYALGLVLYELFTGRRPFPNDPRRDYPRQHLDSRPTRPSSVIENIDLEVERLILKCLEKEPGERPASALAVAAALPGNDVLAVALAANQVPSPELVAAARPLHGSRVAPLVRVCIVAGLLGTLLVLRNINPTPWEQIEKHPAVLEERARDIIKAMGYALQPAAANQASGFFDADHLLDLAPGFQWSTERQDIDELLDSSEMLFWYRQSSAALLPRDIHNILFGYAEVTPLDPPADSAHMISVALDLAGHLRLFMAVPPVDGTGTATPGNAPPTWSPLWEHLEFQRDACDDTAPQILSRYRLNEIRAWAATTAETSWHIEALASHGRPVLVAVIESAAASSSAASAGPDSWLRELSRAFVAVDKRSRRDRGDMAMTLLLSLMLVVAIPWAWCNIQAGRGDRHGAMYLAAGFLILRLFIWLLQVRYVPATDGVFYIAVVLIEALASATIAWLYYIALEPYVRQHWPHMLITWSRVLRLRLRDAAVGQHVTLGVMLGAVLAMLGPIERTLLDILQMPSRPMLISDDVLHILMGGRLALAGGVGALYISLIRGLGFVMLLAVLRAVVRAPTVAATLMAVVLSALLLPPAANLWTGLLIFGLLGAGFTTWMTVRYGLITLIVGIFVANILVKFPLRFDAPFSDLGVLSLLTVTALAGYGFWCARRPTHETA